MGMKKREPAKMVPYRDKWSKQEVSWGLFNQVPELIFLEDGEELQDSTTTFDISDTARLLNEARKAAIRHFGPARKNTLGEVQRPLVLGIFEELGILTGIDLSDQDKGLRIHRLLNYLHFLIHITAVGANSEGRKEIFDFLKDALKTSDLSNRMDRLLVTYTKMRGKKVSPERDRVYKWLEQTEKEAQAAGQLFKPGDALVSYRTENQERLPKKELKRALNSYYQRRRRLVLARTRKRK